MRRITCFQILGIGVTLTPRCFNEAPKVNKTRVYEDQTIKAMSDAQRFGFEHKEPRRKRQLNATRLLKF